MTKNINGKMLSRTSLLPFVWKPRNHGTFAVFGHPPASPCAQKRKPALAIARTKARWGKNWFRPASYHLFFSWHHCTSQDIQQRLVQIWLNKFSFWLREDIPIPTARARPGSHNKCLPAGGPQKGGLLPATCRHFWCNPKPSEWKDDQVTIH